MEKFKGQETQKLNFQVRVHVIEARELQPRDRNGMSDPVCVVECMGKKHHTIVQPKTTICTWDHLMFFELNVLPGEFFTGKIKVTVFDANTILRNVEIGTFEFDINYVYSQFPGHELYRKWIALSDSTAKFPGVQGYVKLSITALAPGDEAPAHNEAEEEDEEQDGTDLQSMVLLPPSIKTEEHLLSIKCFRAEGLPKMDTFGTCDGYVKARFGGSAELKTKVIEKSYAPVWNQKLLLPYTTPTMSDVIKVAIMDWDKGPDPDDTIATSIFRLSEINGTGGINWKEPRWVNFYGIPDGANELTENAKRMSDGGIPGTKFRGRLLMCFEDQVIHSPKAGVADATPVADPPNSNYTLRVDLFEGAELQTKHDVSIEIAIGPFSKEGKKVDCKNGSASWFNSIDDITLTLPTDKTQIPFIFLNLVAHSLGKRSRIGFIRLTPSDLTANEAPKWYQFEPDIFSGIDMNLNVGYLQTSVSLGLTAQMPSRTPLAPPKLTKYQLRAHIYQGRALPSGDQDAASDPFCIIRCGKFSVKTDIIKKSCDPLWYVTKVLDVELPDLSFAPDVNVLVYDWDQVGSNDFLGRFSVSPKTLKPDFQPDPLWYPIYTTDPVLPEGEILASFQLYEENSTLLFFFRKLLTFKTKQNNFISIPFEKAKDYPIPSIKPKFKDCILEISAIGLRDLVGYLGFPIGFPYVVFNCGGETSVKTEKSNKPSGSHPNHLEVLKLNVQIPEDPLFAPPINIQVYDDRVIHKPLVAFRSLNSAQFIPWQKVEVVPENTPPVVENIPGASQLSEETKKQASETNLVGSDLKVNVELQDPTQLDLDTLHLTPQEREEREAINERMKKLEQMSKARTVPDVPESFVQGAEDIKEEDKPKRETLTHELEALKFEPPFGVYKLYRAKKQKGKLVKVEVGSFKGKFRIFEVSKQASVEPPLDLKTLYRPIDLIVRVYVLEGYQLVPKDFGGGNDPYVRVKCGRHDIKDIEARKKNTSRPPFFKCYELDINFPQDTLLEVGVWDWDRIGADDMVGMSKIDLENRYFSSDWKNYQFKPIEYRTLWNPCSSNPQGQLKLWVDIMTPSEAAKTPKEDISPPEPLNCELRLIIWQARNVVFKDAKMSDIFVTAAPDDQKPQSTDVHYRSEDGKGSFNWRMKFPITLPVKTPRLKIQVWDKDFFNPNDAIAEANLNLRSFFNKMYKKRSTREFLNKQWLAMTLPAQTGLQGEIEVSIELLTAEEAARLPAGFGRDEPNTNPFLPKPDRPETSINPLLNPFGMIKNVYWKKYRWKVYLAIGLCCCCIILIIVIYLATFFKL